MVSELGRWTWEIKIVGYLLFEFVGFGGLEGRNERGRVLRRAEHVAGHKTSYGGEGSYD